MRKGKHNSIKSCLRRALCVFFSALILAVSFPDLFMTESTTVYAEGETIYETIIKALVSENLSNAARYDELTDEVIKNTFYSLHTNETNWSTVNIPSFMKALGDLIKDKYTQDVTDPETGVVSTVTVAELNPWSDESADSPGSPYSPGKDFLGDPMNTGYTMGNLVASYAKNEITVAALLTDAQIIAVYDRLAGTDEDSDPFISEESLKSALLGEVSSVSIGGFAEQNTYEYIDTSNLVTYGQYILNRAGKGQGPVPGGTLFIGTWLIDAQCLNETFYRAALASMSTYNQQLMLYKSELAGNNWRDIYGASGLEDILPIAENIEEASLAEYLVSVVVGSDGMPVNAKTGAAVDIFNLSNPYEMEQIPELRALKIQYDADIVSATDTGSKYYIYDRLTKFFNSDSYLVRNASMAEDCKYILGVSARTGIAFYAGDYRFGMFIGSRRIEESGRGFLESIETAAESTTARLNYDWNTYDTRVALIRGPVSWRNEVAWRNEINAAGGIETLRNRIYNFQEVWRHFSCVQDEVTDDYDRKMKGMGNLYGQLRASGTGDDKEVADMALLLLERLDAGRRARVYENLVENEENNYFVGPSLNLLYQQVAYGETQIGRNFNLIMYTDEDFAEVSSITEAVENAITECNKSYIKYSSLSLSPGTTIVSRMEYDLSNNVINNAAQGSAAVSTNLRDLVDLGNVKNNVIAHKSRELTLINKLLEVGDAKFSESVHSSAGETYLKAAADPLTSEKTLEEILSDQKAGVASVATELQSFIKARAMRLPTNDALNFVRERINWAEAQRTGISGDAFGPYAEEALNDHIKWLNDLLNTVKEGGEITDELDDLNAKKATLEQEMLNAYDNNDNETGDRIKNEITEIQKQIDDINAKRAAVKNDPGASAAEKVEAQEIGTQQAAADKIADELLAKIADNDFDNLEPGINALIALESPRLQEVLDALELHGGSKALINLVEDGIAALGDISGDGEGTGTETDDSGNGADTGEGGGDGSDGNEGEGQTGTGGNGTGHGDGLPAKDYGDSLALDEDDFDDAIRESYGEEPYDFGTAEQAAVVAALINFADARNDKNSYDYALDLLDRLISEGNPFIYRQYVSDLSTEYVSLAAVDNCRRYTGFRFVDDTTAFVSSENTASMQQYIIGSASYRFSDGLKTVRKNNGDEMSMDKPTVRQSDYSIRHISGEEYPYIVESASGALLYCTCVYIPGTEWAVLITPQTDKRIAAILDAFDLKADGQ